MFDGVKTYIYERRAGLSKATAITCSIYMVRRYITERLQEIKDKLEEERVARDKLRTRFQRTQEDVSFTVLALLPTMSEQILEDMNIESLIQELQSRAGSRNAVNSVAETPQLKMPSSLSPSTDRAQEPDGHSDSDSVAASVASTSYSGAVSDLGGSLITNSSTSNSWIDAAQSSNSAVSSPPVVSSLLDPTSTDVFSSSGNTESSSVSDHVGTTSDSMQGSTSPVRTKAELWNQVKIQTFTRTLTALYSTTLLSLLTVTQLTVLARSKYLRSIQQSAYDERIDELLQSQLSLSNLMFGGQNRLEELMSGDFGGLLGGEDMGVIDDDISEEVESKFLTMSWWILHVGWKDVGERVRRGVEEVLDGVSLKTKLSATDLHRLVSDIRRRVEHEVTFEGAERRIDFLSSLLPPTPETVHHVLSQVGFSSRFEEQDFELSDASLSSSQDFGNAQYEALYPLGVQPPLQPLHSRPHVQDPQFTALLDETRSIATSSDFSYVLEVCLDRATDLLFSGLEESVFASSDSIHGEEVRIRLAGLLPDLARWSQLALRALPNELIDNLLDTREVTALSALLFSKFEDQCS